MTEISIYQAQEGQELEMIRKGNQLIEARYNLSVFQQLLLIELLPQINVYDADFQDYRIDIAEFSKKNEMGQNKEIYKRVQEALESLVTEPVKIISGEDVFSTAWLSSVKYRKGKGYADVSFHPDLKPLLLLMKNHYTEYPAEAIKGLRSKYAFRFYDWLASYRYKGNGGQFYRVFTISEIREKMALRHDEYKFFKDLRVYAIEPAMNDINNYSDLSILDVEYIKNGRSFEEVKITAEPKKQRQLSINDTLDKKPQETSEELAQNSNDAVSATIIERLVTVGVSENTAKKWLSKYDEERILRNVGYTLAMQKEGKVKSPQLYLSKAIQEDYGVQWAEKNNKEQQEKVKKQNEENQKEQQEKRILDKEKQEFESAIRIFEALSELEQDVILDQVELRLKNLEKARFTSSRAAGTAHKERNYALHFKNVLVENGFDLTT